MGSTKYKLGELISLCTGGNENLAYGEESLRGISVNKELIRTKADIQGVSLSNYTVVSPGCFSFVTVTSRNGNRISIAYNNSEETYIVSSFYVTFKLNDFGKSVCLEDYLFLFFNRGEFDRYARMNSWGSAREYFWFSDIADVVIELPSIAVQKKYVDIFKAMVANQQSYERGLEDLKKTIDALLDRIKNSSAAKPVGELLTEIDARNESGAVDNVQGINIKKQFMPSVADTNGVNLNNYKVVKKGQFAFSGMQTGRDECIRIALYDQEEPIIISPAYSVFEVKEQSILAEYVMMWFSRSESDRRGWFYSDSSIRTNLDLERFYEIKIPVPDKKIQESVVKLYSAYVTRRSINEKLKTHIKDICPILIKGSLEEGK